VLDRQATSGTDNTRRKTAKKPAREDLLEPIHQHHQLASTKSSVQLGNKHRDFHCLRTEPLEVPNGFSNKNKKPIRIRNVQIPTTTPNTDHEKFIPTADIKEDQAILTNSMKLQEKFMEILGEEQIEENFKFMVLK